ncbi:uncharacterized protein RCC_10029 [Ramularia collo-cygni]|uniref:Velvet domain-containing protein n=1 Tax=Ramularia collo-cygni TaxID=112498 RepID=A0A2D3VQC5_9PEZI|nr:uncharacterized protein RCC_10029 [Ramularia collo-cygni]CZT24308.1 uncharacterized protein RCC_10029 [Ramularia collo-cygni]
MMARNSVRLIVRQQPVRAQVVQENNPKNRKPIDPPPIIELKYDDPRDAANSQWLVSPRTFMMVTLILCKDGGEELMPGRNLIGQTVSSLHRLKDINNKDGGFFVFGDISARKIGHYKLRFSLFDTAKDSDQVVYMSGIDSDVFPVLAQRDFGSMSESTHLTRTFSDQGVKLRVRKDNRAGSGIGTKRAFNNASPQDTSSPANHPGIFGGAVQDHYMSSAQSPAAKRHRSSGDYDSAHMYQSQHMPVGEPPAPHYNNSMSSGSRTWASSDQQRVSNSYGPQAHSPLNIPIMNRQQPMGPQTPVSWQTIHQQSALPSPTSTGSNQQPAYPTSAAVSQQQTFGDPGATAAASAVPRQYYNNSYYTQTQGQYPGQAQGDVGPSYPDLSSISDGAALSSGHNLGYSTGYLPTGGIYPAEPGDVPGGFPAYGAADQKF